VVQINAYADDVVVISRNLKAMEKALQELVNTLQEMRMVINKKQCESKEEDAQLT
jgi:hypothetical protein